MREKRCSHDQHHNAPSFFAAAAVPAIAALPAAATASAFEQVDPIIDLAERTIRAWEDHGRAIQAFAPFDQAMMDWRRENPAPEFAAYKTVKAEYDATGQVLNRKEVGEYFVSKMDEGAINKLMAETAAEKRAMANWRRRERRAEERTGHVKADAAVAAACHASVDLIRELTQTRPRTVAGLFAKARVARIVCMDELNEQLAWDSGMLAGEVTAAENAAPRLNTV